MGATDFSVNGNYSYDDVPAGQTDPNLTKFSIAHDMAYTIPLLKQALTVNPAIKVVAVPWSPPAWMKTSGTMNGGNMNTAYFPNLAPSSRKTSRSIPKPDTRLNISPQLTRRRSSVGVLVRQ
jgi:O-glycosyl hydrolase